MPPKPKFTKEEITAAGLKIASEKGIDALTAQELRDELGCSSSPIFTLYNSMKEIQSDVRNAAMKYFDGYTGVETPDMPVFKKTGMKMVLFGCREPKLYQLLFMRENECISTFNDMFEILGDTASVCIKAIEKDYGLDSAKARRLFEHVWIYTFGVGALCATGACTFSEKELGQMLSTQFRAMMMLIKSE